MNDRRSILVVNHTVRNLTLLCDFLEQEGYATRGVGNLPELDRVMAEDEESDLVLIDVSGFDGAIWSRCDSLRERGIPFLVVSSAVDRRAREEGLRHGPVGVLTKPLVKRELMSLLRSLVS